MTARDRLMLIGVTVLAALGAGWLLVVSPERQQASQVEGQVQSARQQLESAQTQAAEARSAERRYATAYASVVTLGKAVPPSGEVPSLIYELDRVSNQRSVNFSAITTGTSGSAPTSTPLSAAGSTAASAAPAGFTQMPFTFVFKGSFQGLAHLLGEVQGFVQRETSGGLAVNGRLLTIQSADIIVENASAATGTSTATTGTSTAPKPGFVPLTATIAATAYVLPAGQTLAGGATPSGPGSAVSSPSSTPTTPAVVKASTP
jgi:type II secretory pathway pseudopilin PulG